MADVKISALTAFTTLDGTETFVAVQGGTTKKGAGSVLAAYVDAAGVAAGIVVTAGETIAAGDLVNLYTDTGNLRAQKADASGTTKRAHGFVLAEITSGNSGTVYTGGTVTGLTGLTPGGDCWLSQSSAGSVTQTAPNEATTGKLIQLVGKALSATTMAYLPGPAIIT